MHIAVQPSRDYPTLVRMQRDYRCYRIKVKKLTDLMGSERIDDLRTFVLNALPVTKFQYPSLPDHDEVLAFCVKHSALHFSKTSGQLASMAEKIDHGGALDLAEATKIVANSLVNTLKLAEEFSISTASIVEFLHEKYKI